MRSLLWTRHRRRDNDAGATAVEFGILAAFVLIPLLLGMIQFGFTLWSMQAGSDAAREASRRLAVAPQCTGIEAFVENRLQGVPAENVAVSTNPDPLTAVANGDRVEVTVSFDSFTFGFFPYDGHIERTGVMSVENSSGDGVC